MKLRDVADRCGVSVATASRVLNGRPGPALSTVQRVLAAADAVGYRPAPPGKRPGYRRSARTRIRHGCVALVLLDDGFHRHADLFVRLIEGVGRAAADHGLELLVVTPAAGAGAGAPLPRRLERGHVDGLLLAGQHAATAAEEPLAPGVPRVWLTSRRMEGRDAVLTGNEQVGVLAAQHLAKTVPAAEAIASFNPLPRHPALRRRCDAFHFTLEEAGRRTLRLANTTKRYATRAAAGAKDAAAIGRPLVREVGRADPAIGGLFVPSDRWLALLHPALQATGRPPAAMVGVGNETAYRTGLDPLPATVELHQGLVGRRAVELLMNRIRGGGGLGPQVASIQAEVVEGLGGGG